MGMGIHYTITYNHYYVYIKCILGVCIYIYSILLIVTHPLTHRHTHKLHTQPIIHSLAHSHTRTYTRTRIHTHELAHKHIHTDSRLYHTLMYSHIDAPRRRHKYLTHAYAFN